MAFLCAKKLSYEGGYDERYFYERETDITAADIDGIAYGGVDAGELAV